MRYNRIFDDLRELEERKKVYRYSALDSVLQKALLYIQHPFKIPILRKITFTVVMGSYSNLLMTIVYFIFNWDITQVVKVGHTQISILFAAIVINIGLINIDVISDIEELKEEMWSLDEAGSEVSQKIDKKNELLLITGVILTVYAMFVAFICLPISGDIREFFVIAYIIGDEVMFGIIHITLYITLSFLKLYLAYALFSTNFMILFIINDVSTHILLLRKKLELMRRIFIEEDNKYYDGTYQKYIDDILRKCVVQHVSIIRYAKLAKREIEKFMVLCIVMGIFCLSFLYIKSKMEHGIRYIVYSFLFQLINVITLCSYCISGQLLTDECNKLHHELCQCPWFLWNKSNKVKFLLFLINTRKPVIITSLGMILNNQLLLLVLRRVISVLAFLERFSGNP